MMFKRFTLFCFVWMLGAQLIACQSPPEATPSAAGEPIATETVANDAEGSDAPPVVTGDFIIESSLSDASILNPILATDSSSFAVIEHLFLGLLTVDRFSGELIGEIATDWESSADGLTYTFQLRDDIMWSDGTPLTALDVKFTYEAVRSDLVESPRKSAVEFIEQIVAVDDHTVQFTFSQVDCTALPNLGLGILPAHIYAADFSDIMTHEANHTPHVTAGPFVFSEWVADEQITLLANANYYLGEPDVAGWTMRIFGNQSAELAAILVNEIDISTVGPQYVSVFDITAQSEATINITKYPEDGYVYVGFNLANPSNPQLGFDDLNDNGAYDAGEPPLAQESHPVFGDRAVRQAIGLALDTQGIIDKVVFGEGQPATANVLPAIEWAFNTELAPYPFDPAAAAALLDEAGWVLNENDGIRYKGEQPLQFTLTTNSGNEVRANIAALMQDALGQIGFDVTIETIEFGTMIDQMLGQTFDAVIVGWQGLGADPDDTAQFAYRNDVPGAGFNFISYHNPTVEENLTDARAVANCEPAERGEYYRANQVELHNDLPYAFLYVPRTNVVANSAIDGIDIGPWSTYHNVQNWSFVP